MSRRVSFASLIFGLALAGCSKQPGPHPNVILISIDTLRQDHLGCYGYSRATSPRIDAFARDSVLYEQAFAPAPWTLPSHAALFTGRHPLELCIVDRDSSIPEDVPVLAEPFQVAGYQTQAFVDSTDGGFVGGRRGFSRGFDGYQHAPLPGARFTYDMAATVTAGLNWLEQRDPHSPFFLFLHTKSVHSTGESGRVPYYKPDPYQKRFLDGRPLQHWSGKNDQSGSLQLMKLNLQLAAGTLGAGPSFPSREAVLELIALYDAGIYYADEQFGRLLDALEAMDLRRNTIIAVVSDHGEAFLEHRFLGHLDVFDAALRIPLILHDPRSPRGLRIGTQAQLVDLFATLLERSGLEAPKGSGGRALFDREGTLASTRLDFSYFLPAEQSPYRAYAVRQGDWKLVWQKYWLESAYETLLFNTLDDPDELRPVLGESERRQRLLSRLHQWLDRADCSDSAKIELLSDELKELEAQGYTSLPREGDGG